MRILTVSPGNNGKYGGKFFYSFHRRLINGFVRAGHFVFPFSDRDTADYAFGLRPLGRAFANRRLLEVARDLQPNVLVFLQSDLIFAQTITDIRRIVPGIKVATISIDDIGDPRPRAQFLRLLGSSDVGFATTGGELLKDCSGVQTVAFIPNLVDVSIDTEVSYENAAHDYDYFFAGHQPLVDPRWAFIDDLGVRLGERSFNLNGGIFGRARESSLSGYDYIRALGRAKVGLNLNRRIGGLYASDRMVQFLGNGLLLASSRGSGFETLFSDDEMLFYQTTDELAGELERVLGDDKVWREMARAGRAKAIATMRETVVAEFILDMLNGEGPCDSWAFSSHVFQATPV